MTPMPRILTISRYLYALLLRAYPVGFRRDYGAEMARVFADSCRDAYAGQGVRGVLGVWRRALSDLAVNVGKERTIQMTNHFRAGRASSVVALVALGCSAALGYENLHNDEVQLALLGLLLATFLLGFVQPKGAWRWAIIVSVGIPISGLLALKIGNAFPCRPGHPYSCVPPTFGDALSSIFVLIPAFLSVYVGAWLRRMTAR